MKIRGVEVPAKVELDGAIMKFNGVPVNASVSYDGDTKTLRFDGRALNGVVEGAEVQSKAPIHDVETE